MNGFFEDVVYPVAIILGMVALGLATVFGIGVAMTTLNSHWNCSAWRQQTGDQVQVIAGDCYVKNGDKWEIFSTYTRNHHVEVTEK